MAALHDVAVAAGGVTEQAELARVVVNRARLIAGGDAAVLRWFEPATNSFRLLASVGTDPNLEIDIDFDSQTAIGGAFKTRQPVIVNDYAFSRQATRWGRRQKVAAQVAVPLMVEGRPVGTLAILSFKEHTYVRSDARFLSLVVAIVAPALEAARLSKEVRRQAALVTQVYDALGVVVIVYSFDGRPLHYNSAAIAAFGPLKDPFGRLDHTYPIYHEDGRLIAANERPFARALQTQAPVRGMVVGYDADGRTWLYVDAVPLFDASGAVESVVTSSIDITQLKAAQEQQWQSEQLFRAAFQASGIGMALTALDGAVIRANPALCELLGHEESDLAGMDARRLVAADDLEKVVETLAGLYLASDPAILSTDLRVLHKDGHAIWVRLTASLIRVAGDPRNVLIHLVDVTEERKAEAILKSEQDRLGEIIEAQSEMAGTEQDRERLLAVLVERTARITATGSVAVLLPRGDQMVVVSAGGAPKGEVGLSLPIESSLAGLAYRSRETLLVSDARTDPRTHAATARSIKLRSIVSTPLMNSGRAIGVLQLMSAQPGTFGETEVRTIQMIAGFAAAAFERASTATLLKASEQRTRAVIESAPDPIVIFDTTGRIVNFNPAAEVMFQRSQAEVVGESALCLLTVRYAEAFARWLRNGKLAGSAEYAGRHFEAAGRRSDGTEFPLEIAVVNLPEETQLAAAFLRDLTLRDRLKESRERLAAVVSNTPVIVLACAMDGTVTLVEGRGLSILGLEPDQAVGRNLRDLLNHQPDAMEFLDRALMGETMTGQLHLTRLDVFLQGAISPIYGPEGAVVGASAVLTDVTDRVRADAVKRESEAKSRLMAMMNHEVRTPLNSILGFAHLLQGGHVGELNEKQRHYVGNIQTSGNHLLALVNDSLDLAKLDAGRAEVNLEDLPLQTVIKQAADQIRPLAEARGLTLVVEPADAVIAHADARYLTQVLLNLLSNGIRHTQPGGSVTVRAHCDGDVVMISIVDTGEGIARQDLPRLFEEFFQAGNHAPGGIGLGLAISRRLVQVMSGSIGVESELGRGSTFTVRLAGRQVTEPI
jgi:protein-histidine pros-kinase